MLAEVLDKPEVHRVPKQQQAQRMRIFADPSSLGVRRLCMPGDQIDSPVYSSSLCCWRKTLDRQAGASVHGGLNDIG